jgi:hypothetical protein
MKSALISGLQNLRNGINDMVGLYQTTLAMLQGEGNAVLDEFQIELPQQDVSALTDAIALFQNFSQTIQGHIDFFNQYSDPSPATERAAINARLETVKTYGGIIVNGVNDRCDGIPALLGDASRGVNKHLTHWVAEVVKKPDGPYAMILGVDIMLAIAESNIQKKDDDLNFFELDKNRWIEATIIQAIYDRAIIDLDQTIKRFETDIMWNLIQSANKYKVLSKPFDDIPLPLTNAEWDESQGTWVTDKLESGFLNNIKTITPPTQSIMFRIVCYDTSEGGLSDFPRTDAFNTKSKQTDIISEFLLFTREEDAPGPDGVLRSVISLSVIYQAEPWFNDWESSEFPYNDIAGSPFAFNIPALNNHIEKRVRERDFLWLNESEIAQVIAVSESNYMLDTVYETITSIRKLTGFYYVAPLEVLNDSE